MKDDRDKDKKNKSGFFIKNYLIYLIHILISSDMMKKEDKMRIKMTKIYSKKVFQ